MRRPASASTPLPLAVERSPWYPKTRMDQIRSDSRLDRKVGAARDRARMRQAEPAFCSARSVWRAKGGQGRSDQFLGLAEILGMEVAGRFLPPGEHLGASLLALRTRSRWAAASSQALGDVPPWRTRRVAEQRARSVRHDHAR
jgi:hypothetical protein